MSTGRRFASGRRGLKKHQIGGPGTRAGRILPVSAAVDLVLVMERQAVTGAGAGLGDPDDLACMPAEVLDHVVDHFSASGLDSLHAPLFVQLGIERRNRDRVAVEAAAAAKRAAQPVAQPVAQRRVDQAQPLFQGTRPSHGGGAGAIGPAALLLMLVPLGAGLAATRRRRAP